MEQCRYKQCLTYKGYWLNFLIELNAMVTEENPAFLPEVDLHSLLVVHLCAEMRGGSTDTPQVLYFARRFSSSSRELMKRLSKCSFNYFTSKKSYYSRLHCAISFKDLSQMHNCNYGSNEGMETAARTKCSTTKCPQHEHQRPPRDSSS